jgi:hypothetical protein
MQMCPTDVNQQTCRQDVQNAMEKPKECQKKEHEDCDLHETMKWCAHTGNAKM